MSSRSLDESPHAGELVGRVPAEILKLARAWQELDFAMRPGRSSELGTRHGSGGPAPDDPARKALRLYAEAKRKEIGRLALAIEKRVREIRFCPTCKAENHSDAGACEHCGARFRQAPSRTELASP